MAAKDIDDVFKDLTDTAVTESVSAFKDLLNQAKADSSKLAQDTARKMEQWLVMFCNGDLTKDELEMLIYARDRAVRQELNTMQLVARRRVEGLAVGMIDLALNKLISQIPG